jgi:hypothetical protein
VAERLVDFLFTCDICLNFNMAVYNDESTHSRLVTDRRFIAWRYLKGTFLFDVCATIPWDLVAQAAMGDGSVGKGMGGGAEHAHRLKALRILRFLQIFRLQRVMNGPSRVLSGLRDHMKVQYGKKQLALFGTACMLCAHWLACVFHFVALVQPGDCNWVNSYYNKLAGYYDSCLPIPQMLSPTVGSRYITSLYWSTMTITTVGYGDVAPQTDEERCVEIAGMLVGAGVYAYVIGSVCGIVNQLSQRQQYFEASLDVAFRLSDSSQPGALDDELSARVRAYLRYVHGRGLAWVEADMAALGSRLSPALMLEVQVARRGRHLVRCRLFKDASAAALAELCSAFTLHTLPPGEQLLVEGAPVDSLQLLHHGIVLTTQQHPAHLRHVQLGSATKPPLFGVECLWQNPRAAQGSHTLSYAELHVVSRDRLVAVLDRHPQARTVARAYAMGRLLAETVREMGVAHGRVKRCAAAISKEEAHSRLAPFGGAAAAAPRRRSPSLNELLDYGNARSCTTRAQRCLGDCVLQLTAPLLLDVVRVAAPEMWVRMEECARTVQRAFRRSLSRKQRRLSAVAEPEVATPPRSAGDARAERLMARGRAAANEASTPGTVTQGTHSADEVAAALRPQLRAMALAIEALTREVAALRTTPQYHH